MIVYKILYSGSQAYDVKVIKRVNWGSVQTFYYDQYSSSFEGFVYTRP